MKWLREWRQRRLERKIYEALFILAMIDDEDVPCAVCDDNCEACICGEQDCD